MLLCEHNVRKAGDGAHHVRDDAILELHDRGFVAQPGATAGFSVGIASAATSTQFF
jgi:hypothetical protein